jgi:hypothetical protein
MKHPLAVLALASLFFVVPAGAQQPTPPLMVVQAANAPAPPNVTNAAPAPDKSSPSLQIAIKALQKAKAANDETLKKQEAMLQQLDELQKAAEQLKVFSKRG